MNQKMKKHEEPVNCSYQLKNVGGWVTAQWRDDFHCDVCDGQGRLYYEDEKGLSFVKDCDCRIKARWFETLNRAKIPGKFIETQLATYHPLHPSQRMAKTIAQDFIDDYPQCKQGLIFMGKPGLGKTHLAVGIIRQLILDRGVQCRFVDFFQLLSDIRHGYSQDISEQAIIKPYVDTELLVIDELAKGRNTDWELTLLDQIISSRYNAADKITLFTTNFMKSDDPLDANESAAGDKFVDVDRFAKKTIDNENLKDKVGARIYSRMAEICRFVPLEGEDFRQGMLAMQPRK